MPLTPEGYIAERSADFLLTIQQAVEAALVAKGITPEIDWESDVVYGVLAAVMSVRLGDIAEAVQQIYDSRDINNAQGVQLAALGRLVGVARNEATRSTAVVALTGAPFTFIAIGRRVEGGGEDGRARWATTADVTLDGTGAGSVIVEAVEVGPSAASPGEIDAIVDLVSGWTAVSNPADAEPGRLTEADAAYQLRIVQSGQIRGSASTAALRAQLRDLDFLIAALVLENDTDAPAVVSGITVDARAVAVILYPSTLTPAQVSEVASVIYGAVPMGISTSPIVTPGEVATIDGFDGLTKIIRWDYAVDVPISVTVVVVLADGTVLGDVTAPVRAAVAGYVEALQVGDASRRLRMLQEIAEVPGVVGATVTQAIFPAGPGAQDLVPTAAQRLTLQAPATVTT